MRSGQTMLDGRFLDCPFPEKPGSKISCARYIPMIALGCNKRSTTLSAAVRISIRSIDYCSLMEFCVGCQRAAAFNLITQGNPRDFWESASTSHPGNRRNSKRNEIAHSYHT